MHQDPPSAVDSQSTGSVGDDHRGPDGQRDATLSGSFRLSDALGTPQLEALVKRDSTRFCNGRSEVLCRGAPVFVDRAIADVAASRGAGAAWLALYREHGTRAPERVQGRFAVVVIDHAAMRAFAAVDRFGIETLCYAAGPDHLAFADRADSVPGVSTNVDPQAIFHYLWFHVIPAPRTIFHGVSRLSPGHYLAFRRDRCDVARYWNPEFTEDHPVPLQELVEEFKGLLRAAIARVADTESLGCYLSGGTDSSTVAGMTGVVTTQPARTYSIGFDVAGYDEMAYARIAAKHFGTDHHEYYVSPRDIVDTIPALAVHFDQPFGNSSALPAYCCARMARQDGVTRMLAGDGGDELFGGNTRYARQRVFSIYDQLPAALRHGLVEPLAASRAFHHLPLLRKTASYVEQARVPMPDRMEMYNLLLRIGLDEIFEPAFLGSVDTGEPLSQQRRVYAATPGHALINRMLAYDWKYTLADNDLPKVVGSAGLAGMAVAFPLLDERLVDFSLRLAPNLKLRGLRLRWFFKHALADFLPPEILKKQKHGFGLPFGAWVIAHRELRELVADSLCALKRRRIVRAAFIDELLEKQLPAHPGYYGEMVWILTMLEQWYRASETSTGLG